MSEQDEFDRIAGWSVEAIDRLGRDHAIPGACRGSGGPGALRWLSDWILDGFEGRFLDQGGGLGGPSAWLDQHCGVRPVVAEPMHGAAAGARHLFGLEAVQAHGARLPFAAATFAAAWSLGVLSTVADPAAVLAETVRALRPGGRVGLVVYVADGDRPVDEPEGNHFPTRRELAAHLDRVGLEVVRASSLDDLAAPGEAWDARAEEVDRVVADLHRHDPAWRRSRDSEDHVARLLAEGRVTGRAVCAVT